MNYVLQFETLLHEWITLFFLLPVQVKLQQDLLVLPLNYALNLTTSTISTGHAISLLLILWGTLTAIRLIPTLLTTADKSLHDPMAAYFQTSPPTMRSHLLCPIPWAIYVFLQPLSLLSPPCAFTCFVCSFCLEPSVPRSWHGWHPLIFFGKCRLHIETFSDSPRQSSPSPF